MTAPAAGTRTPDLTTAAIMTTAQRKRSSPRWSTRRRRTRDAAELTVAMLERPYDEVLRRLDGGDGAPSVHATYRHNPALTPEDCLGAVLHELAGARLSDRAATLAHGLEALHHLTRERDEARAWARGYEHGMFTVDTDEPPAWLTKRLADED